jgi:hypothetical protein
MLNIRPATIGYDVSGIIVTCGAHVTKFKAGDAVFCMLPHDRNGGVAEYDYYFVSDFSFEAHKVISLFPQICLCS